MSDDVQGGSEGGFAQSAAKLSIAMPVFVILLGGVWVANRWENTKALLGFICMLLIGLGTLLAIVALCNAGRERSGSGLVRRGVLGLVFNGVFVLIFGLAFASGVSQGVKARQADRELARKAEKLREKSRQSSTAARTADVPAPREDMEKARVEFKTQDALMAKAWSAYAREIENRSGKWQELYQELGAAKVLDFGELNGKQELKERQALVNRYKATSDAMRDLVVNSADFFRAELNKLGATPARREEAVKTFQAQLATRNPVLLEIRDLDTRMSDNMLGVLSLLETNWGRWSCPAGRVVFEDDQTLRECNALLLDLQRASKEQFAAQKKLASLNQKTP